MDTEYRDRVLSKMREHAPMGTRANFEALAAQIAKGHVTVMAVKEIGLVYMLCEDEDDAVPLIAFLSENARMLVPLGIAIVVRSIDVVHEALVLYQKSLQPSRWQRFWNWVWRRS